MISYTGIRLFLLLISASLSALAQTPPGFDPPTEKELPVKWGGQAITPGTLEPATALGEAPTLGMTPVGSSDYVAFIMDLSVVLEPNTAATTLIHWIQPNLQSQSDTPVLTAKGTSPLVPYFPPGPPPGQTHNYVVLLFNQTSAFRLPESWKSDFSNITASVNNRIGFNLTKFLGDTGLVDRPVAANWFRVSSPAANVTSTTSTPATTKTKSATSTATTTPSGVAASQGTGLRPVFTIMATFLLVTSLSAWIGYI